MLLETYNHLWDFELLDTGAGYRLEKWGKTTLARPDPQIIWPKSLPEDEWNKATAIYKNRPSVSRDRSRPVSTERGEWQINKPLPRLWIINFQNIKFLLKLSPFKHTGLFAEQAANWEFMIERLKDSKLKNSKPKILNLFAYTGAATVILAKAGCQVTHVDASKPALNWANENYHLNFVDVKSDLGHSNKDGSRPVPTPSVRWILDDAIKFVKRELKRGVKYDGIIMDPPAFGHSPQGKPWKFNINLPELLTDCVKLLSDNAKFLIINAYATNSSALALNNLLEDATKGQNGKIEFGELCLKQSNNRMISTGIFARWST